MLADDGTRAALRRRQYDRATLLMEQAVSMLLDVEEFYPDTLVTHGEVSDLAIDCLDVMRIARGNGSTGAPTLANGGRC